MKKIVSLLLALSMLFVLCACGSNTSDTPIINPSKVSLTDYVGEWVEVGRDGFTCFIIKEDGTGKVSRVVGKLFSASTFTGHMDGNNFTLNSKSMGVTVFTIDKNTDTISLIGDNGLTYIPMEKYKTEHTTEIINNNGETENLLCLELMDIRDNNELKFESLYSGAQISLTDTVMSVNGEGLVNGHMADGYLELNGGWLVELSKKDLALAATLDINQKIRVVGKLDTSNLGGIGLRDCVVEVIE